jgi:predicted nucleic acid-binding Zn ribbon protein
MSGSDTQPAPDARAADPTGSQGRGRRRVACPQGHTVRVPEHLLGRSLFCPTCSVAFSPKLSDTAEYRAEQRQMRRERDERRARRWLWIAVGAALIVVITLLVMLVSGG